MFVNGDGYKACLKKMIADEEGLDAAVAFWGDGAQKLFHIEPIKPVRIICNLRTGGTNPKVIKYFLDLAKANPQAVQIKQCDELHAKVIVGERQALIGSANLSTNGLGLEDGESAHWIEAGLHVQDAKELKSIKKWFNELWSAQSIRDIDATDINLAAEAWRRNREKRPVRSSKGPFALDKWPVSELRDRAAYVLFYKDDLSPEATKARDDVGKGVAQEMHLSQEKLDLWAFENWPTFPKSSSSSLDFIGVFIDSKNKVNVEGVCRMLDRRLVVSYKNSKKGKGHIDLAQGVTKLLGCSFQKKEMSRMKVEIESCIDALWKEAIKTSNDKKGGWLHIADLAIIVEKVSNKSIMSR